MLQFSISSTIQQERCDSFVCVLVVCGFILEIYTGSLESFVWDLWTKSGYCTHVYRQWAVSWTIVYYDRFLFQPPPKPGNFSASQMSGYVAKYKAAFALKALVTRQRATHPKGVGAIGTLTVLDNPHLPKHDFFEAGRVFPLRLRHANLVRPDDAQLDVRAVSLKFADSDFESPFDLMMHTGEEAAFWNIVSFDKMLTALSGGSKTFKAFCLEDPWQ